MNIVSTEINFSIKRLALCFTINSLKVILLIMCLYFSCGSLPKSHFIAIQYGYGKQFLNGEYGGPYIYSLHAIQEVSRVMLNNKFAWVNGGASTELVNVKLNAPNELDGGIVELIVSNNDSTSYFLHKRYFPIGEEVSEMCDDIFAINKNNISMAYFGENCRFDYNKSSWIEIKSRESINYTVDLRRAYYFLPEGNSYKIFTTNFIFVDERWFSEIAFFDLLFSIIDGDGTCFSVNNPINYVNKFAWLCAKDVQKEPLMDFLHNNFLFGEGPVLEVRPKPIYINVNGGSEVRK